MPCIQCENGKWKWGETGTCQYDSREACEQAHEGEHDSERKGTMKDQEKRSGVGPPEIRAAEGDKPAQLVGYAAKFDIETELGWFREKIAPAAFDRAIREKHDVRYLFNHDPNHILGRTSRGTARISVDKIGLQAEVDILNGTAREVYENVELGNVSGMSFAFRVLGEEWTDLKEPLPLRTITDVELFDVSAVVYPAYPETDVAARSLDRAKTEEAPRAPEEVPPPTERLAREIALLERKE